MRQTRQIQPIPRLIIKKHLSPAKTLAFGNLPAPLPFLIKYAHSAKPQLRGGCHFTAGLFDAAGT